VWIGDHSRFISTELDKYVKRIDRQLRRVGQQEEGDTRQYSSHSYRWICICFLISSVSIFIRSGLQAGTKMDFVGRPASTLSYLRENGHGRTEVW
jgi:hypothetical protein